jgi:diguanylate cyclase (GGDEF)-like protein/PAS domain S-box-containing protein
MYSLLRKLILPQQIEYIIVSPELLIIEYSPGTVRFADNAHNLVAGKEIGLSLPELIGLEEICQEVLQRKRQSFELEAVARSNTYGHIIYMNIYINHLDNSDGLLETNSTCQLEKSALIILLQDVTNKIISEQKFSQVAKEYCLALEALEDSKNYLDKVISAITEVLFVVNEHGIIQRINQSTQKVFGYTEAELCHHPLALIIDDAHLGQQLNTKFDCELLHGKEIICCPKAGAKIYIEFSCSPLDSHQVGLQGSSVCIGRDVTERKLAEKEFRQRVKRQHVLNRMTQRIRQTLNLTNILKTTSWEVRRWFKTEVVLIYKFTQPPIGEIVNTCYTPLDKSPEDLLWRDKAIFTDYLDKFRSGKNWLVTDKNQEMTNNQNAYDQWLISSDVRSQLIMPIFTHQWSGVDELAVGMKKDNQLWGLLIIYQLHQPRTWQAEDITLLHQLVNQLAIAIQQAELYAKLQQANHQLEELINIDALTQIANRRYFDQVIAQEWLRIQRASLPISLILCDVDHFKLYNDTYGHIEGDHCLQAVAKVLANSVKRPADLAARYGGEEFAVILPETDMEGALHIAEQIRINIMQLMIPHQTSLTHQYVTLSLGVATAIPQLGVSHIELMALADQALYEAKENGRNSCAARFLNIHH